MLRLLIMLLLCGRSLCAEEAQLRAAIARSLPLLEKTMMITSEKRSCFTCHNQGLPVMTLLRARNAGFTVDEEKIQSVLQHISKSLERGKKNYREGRGQGGKVDMAGYALWTLADGAWAPDEITEAVCGFILQWQGGTGHWKRHANRPPSEASTFTTTYLGLLSLDAYATEEQQAASQKRMREAGEWLRTAKPKDTEDRVFHLRSLYYVKDAKQEKAEAARALLELQRQDGGWSQKPDLESDAYATGSVLCSLIESGEVAPGHAACDRAVRHLLKAQMEDGSWQVKSRSKPFQKYFESGFPHGKDQYISCAASCWAVMALLEALPDSGE